MMKNKKTISSDDKGLTKIKKVPVNQRESKAKKKTVSKRYLQIK